MSESNINAYHWRELSPEEYERFEKENLIFYHALDVIIFLFFLAVLIIGLISAKNVFFDCENEDRVKNIVTLVFMLIAGAALWRGRAFVRHLGLDDIKNRNLVACEGSFVRLEERTRGRAGTTRFDYYAVVRMPDGYELAVECSLSDVDKSMPGDRITVIRPKDSVRVQRMNILMK